MGSRLQCSIEMVNKMTLEEFACVGNPHTQDALLKRLAPAKRDELKQECYDTIIELENKIGQVGFEAASPKTFQGRGFMDPYTLLKKYSHVYTVLAGWMTNEDLGVRESGVIGYLEQSEYRKWEKQNGTLE